MGGFLREPLTAERKKELKGRLLSAALYLLLFTVLVYLWRYPAALIPFGRIPAYLLQFPGGCILRQTTGLYCPGCGGTRAVLALISGRPAECLKDNPSVYYFAFLLFAYVFSPVFQRLGRGRLYRIRPRAWHFYLLIAIILVWFVVRDILLLNGIDLLAG
ncbi:MAG: DUF2752 domain-containing protein [Lachnospiraceae bacterium]|nr:DUF2752 domain-containing protein [Lachnospiraceae bacterium]